MSGYNSKKRGVKPRKQEIPLILPEAQNPNNNWQKGFQDALGQQKPNSNWTGNPSGVGLGGVTNPKNPNPNNPWIVTPKKEGLTMDSDWSDILKNLGSGSDFTSFLASLGIGGTDPYDMSMHDMNQEIIKQILQYYITSEQRGYDRALQLDQRLYDTPTNQLARLMGAGISRDAAIQMLSGGSGGSSAGVPYGITGNQSQLESASQAYANQMSGATAIANTVFGAIGTVSSLVGLGFTVPQAIQQTEFLKNNNLLNKSQLASYQSASKAYEILNGAGVAADAVGSVSKVSDVISKLAENGNTDALSFIESGGLKALKDNSYFTSQALHNLYRSERSSDDYDRSFGAYVDKTEAEADFIRADKQRVVQSILNLKEELQQVHESTEFIKLQQGLIEYSKKVMSAQADLLRKQGKVAEADALLKKAQKLNVESSTTAIDYQNQYTQSLYGDKVGGLTGLQILTHRDAVNAYNDMKKFVSAKDKKLWDKEINYLALNYERLSNLALLQSAYTSGALDKYNSDPDFKDLMNTCGAFTECGAWDYMNIKYDAYKHNQLGVIYNDLAPLLP